MERGLDWSRSEHNRDLTQAAGQSQLKLLINFEEGNYFGNRSWHSKIGGKKVQVWLTHLSEICDIMLFCVDGHSVPIYWRHMVQAPYEDMRTPHWGGSGGWKTADWVQHGDGGELKTGEKSKFFFWTSETSEAWSEKVPRPTRHPVAAAPWWSTPRWSTRPSWSSWPSWWSRPRACCLPGNNWNWNTLKTISSPIRNHLKYDILIGQYKSS